MALLDCAINKKCSTVDGGRGICPLFSSPPRGICQLKSPHPREFAIQGKKNANSRGSARGGGWAQVELTDALPQNDNENEVSAPGSEIAPSWSPMRLKI